MYSRIMVMAVSGSTTLRTPLFRKCSRSDPLGASGDRSSGGQKRREIPILDEVVLGQPHVVESVVLTPDDLIEDLAIEPVGRLAPLGRISEVVPETEA